MWINTYWRDSSGPCSNCGKATERQNKLEAKKYAKYLAINIDKMQKKDNQHYTKANVRHSYTNKMSFISDSDKQELLLMNTYAINGGLLHIGSDGSYGHYTAIIRLRGNIWVEYNDDNTIMLTDAQARAKLEEDGVTLIYKRIYEEAFERRSKIKTKPRMEIETQTPTKSETPNKNPPKVNTTQNSKEVQSRKSVTPKNTPTRADNVPTQKKISEFSRGNKDGRPKKLRQSTITFEKKPKN